MPSSDTGTVHIIGAGLAGLAAAVRLTAHGRRVMVHEATEDSERLRWMVEHHVRPFYDLVRVVWERLRTAGIAYGWCRAGGVASCPRRHYAASINSSSASSSSPADSFGRRACCCG